MAGCPGSGPLHAGAEMEGVQGETDPANVTRAVAGHNAVVSGLAAGGGAPRVVVHAARDLLDGLPAPA